MATISFLPKSEFDRILSAQATPQDRARLFATFSRINTLYMVACAWSGHLGSSFSAMDLVSWLFLEELQRTDAADYNSITDVYFSSKGHDVPGLYASMIGLGMLEFEKINQLRRLGGLPGHPDVSRIPQVHTNTGPLGTGISKAHGMAIAHRLLGKKAAIYVLTGDGELQEGQIWESLQPAANQKMHEITVIVDHNKLQSDTYVNQVSDLGDLERKFASFGWEVARCDGHDYQAFSEILARFKTITDRPKILIADTKKGCGVSFMEPEAMANPRLYQFHSGAPDQATYEKALAELVAKANEQLAAIGERPVQLSSAERPTRVLPSKPDKLIDAYSRALVAQGEANPTVVALDGDLALDCGLLEFEKRFPERFFECGIAEQDMVSQAGGMALKGLLPIVHSFSCFLSTRPNEQIFNNASERSKVIYVGSLAGILPGGPGHSHQCVRDISSVGGNPGLTMIEPSCEAEVALALDYAVNRNDRSTYIRLISIPVDIPFSLPSDYSLEKGKGSVIHEGSDIAVFAYGPVLLAEAYRAAETTSHSVRVINLPWLNSVDAQWLASAVKGCKAILTLDNQFSFGSQGQLIAATLATAGLANGVKIKAIALDDFPHCGQNSEVLKAHGLDSESLKETFDGLL